MPVFCYESSRGCVCFSKHLHPLAMIHHIPCLIYYYILNEKRIIYMYILKISIILSNHNVFIAHFDNNTPTFYTILIIMYIITDSGMLDLVHVYFFLALTTYISFFVIDYIVWYYILSR